MVDLRLEDEKEERPEELPDPPPELEDEAGLPLPDVEPNPVDQVVEPKPVDQVEAEEKADFEEEEAPDWCVPDPVRGATPKVDFGRVVLEVGSDELSSGWAARTRCTRLLSVSVELLEDSAIPIISAAALALALPPALAPAPAASPVYSGENAGLAAGEAGVAIAVSTEKLAAT